VFLYIFSNQFFLSSFIDLLWQKVIPWFADLIGHTPEITTFANGSGDTTYNYYQILFFAIVSLVLAIGIALIDRERKNYRTALSWLTILIRYYLAYQMIAYGMAKLFGMQFGSPTDAQLSQELGDFSPMGLLWIFMSFSKEYSIFTGALEIIAGILLLNRYTTTLGALASFGVMLNVMMLNFCYDVPVKILSTHLVILSIILIALDAKRLTSIFFSNRSVDAYAFDEVLPKKYRKIIRIIKWMFIVGFFSLSFYQTNQFKKKYDSKDFEPLFRGRYEVVSFERKPSIADTVKSGKKRTEKWLTFEHRNEGTASIKTSFGHKYRYGFIPDTLNKVVRMKINGVLESQNLQYELLDSNRVRLYGLYEADTLDIVMKKQDSSDRLLINRGFHWVNEFPFNR
jgi:uncharacterized membrane protein YphA (DoxX/SURF4 family)